MSDTTQTTLIHPCPMQTNCANTVTGCWGECYIQKRQRDQSSGIAFVEKRLYDEAIQRASAALSGVRVPEAASDVLAERRRQVEQEGWTAEHDDSHDKGDMALAGACYAMHTSMMYLGCAKDDVPSPWPWDKSWWKPKDPRRNLVRAAALILAEIERIDRLAAAKGER